MIAEGFLCPRRETFDYKKYLDEKKKRILELVSGQKIENPNPYAKWMRSKDLPNYQKIKNPTPYAKWMRSKDPSPKYKISALRPRAPPRVKRSYHGDPSQLEDAVHKHLRALMIFHECLRLRLGIHNKNNNYEQPSDPLLYKDDYNHQSRLFYIAENLGFLIHDVLLPYLKQTAVLPFNYGLRPGFFPESARGMKVVELYPNSIRNKVVDEGPPASLCSPTSSEVNWTTPSHLVDVHPPVFNNTPEASRKLRNGYVTKICEYLTTNMVRQFPLTSPSLGYVGEKLDNVESAVGEIRSLEVEDRIVSEVGNFAVDAFNNVCEMHVRKGEHNSLQYFEFMECKYFRVSRSNYYFYIAIEAIEEENPGAYVAEVAWNFSNGERSLYKFVRTNSQPFGALATSVFYLWSVEALGDKMCDFYEEKRERLGYLHFSLNFRHQPTAFIELGRLAKIHFSTMEDLGKKLSRDTEVLLPPDFNRKTWRAHWTDPDYVQGSGMVRRVGGTTSGYDYYNPEIGTGRPEANTPTHPSFLKTPSKGADVVCEPNCITP